MCVVDALLHWSCHYMHVFPRDLIIHVLFVLLSIQILSVLNPKLLKEWGPGWRSDLSGRAKQQGQTITREPFTQAETKTSKIVEPSGAFPSWFSALVKNTDQYLFLVLSQRRRFKQKGLKI